MEAYYQNIGLWLAKPSQRQSMLVSGIWGVLRGSAPMEFSTNDSAWKIGERVLATMGLTASPCLLKEWIDPILDPTTLVASSVPKDEHKSAPTWSGLSQDVVNRAIVGGIGSALVGLALEHREVRARGERPRLNAEDIRRRVVDGISRGRALVKQVIDDAAASLNVIQINLDAAAKQQPIAVRIPIDILRLRVIAERLQFLDPTDPVLMNRDVTITIRIRLDDDIVIQRTLESLEIPSFDARGGVVDLSFDVGEVEVQTGESLSVEVLVGSLKAMEPRPEIFRFIDTLRGDASSWIGKSIPSRSQAWRLWYRIEESNPQAEGASGTSRC
jgi:hypothetical protein